MRIALALLVACVLLAGCASTGDLHSIVESNRQFEASVTKSLAELKAGSIPVAEFETRVTQRCSELRGEVTKVRQHAEQRVNEVASTALTLGDGGAIAGAITLAGLIAQHFIRNRSRGRDPRISNDYVRVQRQGASFDESS